MIKILKMLMSKYDDDYDNKQKYGLAVRHKVHATKVSSLQTGLFGASLLACTTQTHIVG